MAGALFTGSVSSFGGPAVLPSAQTESFQGGDEVQVMRRAAHRAPGLKVKLKAVEVPKSVRRKAARSGVGPVQVGYGRELPASVSKVLNVKALDWTPTADHGRVAVVSLKSPGAAALRVALLVYRMPPRAELNFFSAGGAQGPVLKTTGAQINGILARDRAVRDPDASEPLLYWGPLVDGDTLGIEIYLPAGTAPADLVIAFPQLSHLFASPTAAPPNRPFDISDSQDCSLDYTCYRGNLGDVGPAVARMLFTQAGATFSCTGTLVNDLDPNSQIPYLLTARHCISSQSVASTLQTYWFFRTGSCGGTLNRRVGIRSGGAVLLTSIQKTDTSLLRLNDNPPDGALLVGWDTKPVAGGQNLVSISHPAGDLKKVAFGRSFGYATCALPDNDEFIYCSDATFGNYIKLRFTDGMAEGGSSGSGLFLPGNHRLVGTLTGGNASCDFLHGNIFFGRFDVAYREGLADWLAVTDPCRSAPGSWGYCSNPACGPCAEGEGDCDSDQECQDGLVCASDVGPDHGFGATVDACQKPGGAPIAGICALAPGDWDYCSDPNCGPCAFGEGDCDSHSECRANLLCLPDTGVSQGFFATVDTCGVRPTGTCDLANGDWDYCSDLSCGPCAAGQGDCDGDTDCNAGLACSYNVGAKYGLPAEMDICELPRTRACTKSVGDWGYCADPACAPCSAGQGDCDANAECAEGLVCTFNAGERYGLPPTQDVCEAPPK